MKRETFWLSPVAGFDDFGRPIAKVFYDGKTKQGPWAIMTPESFAEHGIAVGLGAAQRYELQENGDWLATEGTE